MCNWIAYHSPRWLGHFFFLSIPIRKKSSLWKMSAPENEQFLTLQVHYSISSSISDPLRNAKKTNDEVKVRIIRSTNWLYFLKEIIHNSVTKTTSDCANAVHKFEHLSMGQAYHHPPSHRTTLCRIHALMPASAVYRPHVCHRQDTGLSPKAHTCSRKCSLWVVSNCRARCVLERAFTAPPGTRHRRKTTQRVDGRHFKTNSKTKIPSTGRMIENEILKNGSGCQAIIRTWLFPAGILPRGW